MADAIGDRSDHGAGRLIAELGRLLAYEWRILRLSAVGVAVGLLGAITVIVTLGPPHRPATAIFVFEDVASLALLPTTAFILAVDQELRTLELVLLAARSPSSLYVRRFLLTLAADVVVVAGLAAVWRAVYLPLPVSFLLTVALPPMAFVAALSFVLSLLARNANTGVMLAAAYWLLHQLLLRGFGDQGLFGHLFLFKATYYPRSPTFAANRYALLGLAVCLLIGTGLVLRRMDRYL